MTDRITPALTAEEWAEATPDDMPGLLSHYGDGVDMLADPLGPRRSLVESRHALMALANRALPDDSPHKFTDADVRTVLSAWETSNAYGDGDSSLRRVALKIAALLPDT